MAFSDFNLRSAVETFYGCVSSGTIWRFLKLEGTQLRIDRPEYYLSDAGKIVGTLISILYENEGV
ncbi:MAG: hypothetical protein ACYC3I_12255 [Gemmataceae bacterium]